MSSVAQDEINPTNNTDLVVPPPEGETAPARGHLRLVVPESGEGDGQMSDNLQLAAWSGMPGEDPGEGKRSGALLRTKRENLGLTIDQVARETRIRADHLRAIEDMTPNLVGARVFVEGHIRSYARHLGLQPDEILNQYRRECAILSDPEKQELAPPVARPRSTAAPFVGLAVVLLVGAGVGAILLNQPQGEIPAAAAASGAATAAAVEAADGVAAPPLRIVALRRARIEIRGADGTKFIGREFEPGYSYAPRVGAGWTVSTLEGDAFEWRLGDQSLGLFAPNGGPVNYQSVDVALQRQPLPAAAGPQAAGTGAAPGPSGEASQRATSPARNPTRNAPAAAEGPPQPQAAAPPVPAATPQQDPALLAYPE